MIGVDPRVDAGGAVPMCTGHLLSGRRSGSSRSMFTSCAPEAHERQRAGSACIPKPRV
jgi:hypothetical protein